MLLIHLTPLNIYHTGYDVHIKIKYENSPILKRHQFDCSRLTTQKAKNAAWSLQLDADTFGQAHPHCVSASSKWRSPGLRAGMSARQRHGVGGMFSAGNEAETTVGV